MEDLGDGGEMDQSWGTEQLGARVMMWEKTHLNISGLASLSAFNCTCVNNCFQPGFVQIDFTSHVIIIINNIIIFSKSNRQIKSLCITNKYIATYIHICMYLCVYV